MAANVISIQAESAAQAVEQMKMQLSMVEPALILFFASSIYEGIAEQLEKAFPNVPSIGSTSHSEYCGTTFQENSIAFMVLDQDTIEDLDIHVVEHISDAPEFGETLDEIHNHFGGYEHILDKFDRYVGVVLFEASAKAEEYCMDKIGNATDILYIGGTSSEKNGLSRVYANGKSYENAAVLATLKTTKGYQFLKTQSASVYSKQGHTVTKSDMKRRVMYELDGRPVAEVYAEILDVPEEKVSNYFVSNPLGVLAGDEIFIRTFDKVQPDGGISLHCGIPEGTEIHVLKIGDIIEDTKKALDQTIVEPPAAVVNFNCLYRTLEIEAKNVVQEYCDLFGRYPSVGFSTAGEAFLGHINETSTILVLK